MPCNSDYMEPSSKEQQLQRTAGLLVFVLASIGVKPDAKLIKASKNCYCTDDYVEELCSTLQQLTDQQQQIIIYNAHSKTSRDLADWWEEHRQADMERIKIEKEKARIAQIRKTALEKLTLAEIKALGIQDC